MKYIKTLIMIVLIIARLMAFFFFGYSASSLVLFALSVAPVEPFIYSAIVAMSSYAIYEIVFWSCKLGGYLTAKRYELSKKTTSDYHMKLQYFADYAF